MNCPEEDSGKVVLCVSCFAPVKVPGKGAPVKNENKLILNMDEGRLTGDFDFLGLGAQAPKATVSQLTPPAPPVQAKDPDKALANTALGVLRLNNWECKEDDDYRSFTVTVKIRSQKNNVLHSENYRVTADNGLLVIEVPVLALAPEPANALQLLMVLNDLNMFAVGGVLLLTTQGIVMRHAMIPHSQQDGYFNVKMLQHCLRQIEFDRRRARTVLQPLAEFKDYDPFAAEAAFKTAIAPGPVSVLSPKELLELAIAAGYSVHSDPRHLCIARPPAKADLSKVHLVSQNGHVRGTVSVGVITSAKYVFSRCPARIRQSVEGSTDWPSGKIDQLYWLLNTLNHVSGVIKFVAMDKRIVATATHFPTDRQMDTNQFTVMANALIECAEASASHGQSPSA